LQSNVTHQLLVYNENVNILSDNINTTKKSTESLLEATRMVGVAVNTKKTKYMDMSHHQNARQITVY